MTRDHMHKYFCQAIVTNDIDDVTTCMLFVRLYTIRQDAYLFHDHPNMLIKLLADTDDR